MIGNAWRNQRGAHEWCKEREAAWVAGPDLLIYEPSPERTDPRPDKWAAVDLESHWRYFDTEDDACAFQRRARELHGLDPITGE